MHQSAREDDCQRATCARDTRHIAARQSSTQLAAAQQRGTWREHAPLTQAVAGHVQLGRWVQLHVVDDQVTQDLCKRCVRGASVLCDTQNPCSGRWWQLHLLNVHTS